MQGPYRRSLFVSAVASLLASTLAQTEPTVSLLDLTPIDHGMGGMLVVGDRHLEFHVEATGVRACLRNRRAPKDAAAQVLEPGSAAETELLRLLQSWCNSTFSAEEQRELLALERLPAPLVEEANIPHARQSLLRAVRLYAEVTRPEITKVVPGRGTVTLTLQLKLGDNAPEHLLWRRFGDDAYARMHVGTETEPVAIPSRAEDRLVVALAEWLVKRLGKRELLWAGEPADLGTDVRAVLDAYRGYLTATSPRLRSSGEMMDRRGGGSRVYVVSDARNATTSVRFDRGEDSVTPGRLFVEGKLVDLGSKREVELIAMLQRAATLRRGWFGAKADADGQLKLLEASLADYRAAFPAKK